MTAAMAMPRNMAQTFLVHFFGPGLVDDRYMVEHDRASADDDIVPAPTEALAAKGGGRVKRTTVTRKVVKELRPATAEIIIYTGLKTCSGWQLRGRSRPAYPATVSRRAEGLFPDVLPSHPRPGSRGRRRGVPPLLSGSARRRRS